MKVSRWPFVVYVGAAVLVALQKGVIADQPGNFLRFHDTFYRLITGGNIYYPPVGEITGFLYSPTFALLFAPFAVLPSPLGLVLWNVVNALALYYGLTRLLPQRAAQVALVLVFFDLLRALQNFQSNALVAGLILLTFLGLERRREAMAAGAMLLGAVTKIFPLAAGVLGLLSPRRGRFVLWSFVIGLVLALLPLLVLSPTAFVQVNRDWLAILERDTGLQGQSVMRILTDWFGVHVPNWTVQLAGILLLLAPVVARRSIWDSTPFRLRFLCSLMVFLVVFNHQAESSSFVIATTGVAIWFATTRRSWWRTALLALVLLGVSVPRLFLFPYHTYHDVIQAHALDAFPCLLVWLALQLELWTWPSSELSQGAQGDVSASETGAHVG